MARVLMISPTPSHPATAGNRVRVAALARDIEALGHELHFVHVAREAGDEHAMRRRWGHRFTALPYRAPRRKPLSRRLRRWGRRLGMEQAYLHGVDDWYDPNLDQPLSKLADRWRFDAVIVEYLFFSRAFANFPSATRRILDTHDVFSHRHRLYLQRGESYDWFSCRPTQERRALERADTVIAIKDAEAEYFRSLTTRPVVTVGHCVEGLQQPQYPQTEPGTLLLVGSANRINIDSVHWFLRNVFPRIVEADPTVRLQIVGDVCSGLEAAPPRVELVGRVADLRERYAKAAVVVNPMQFGTGLKIKTVEALAHGKPLVTTSVGAEGLEDGAGKAYRIADDPETFAEQILRLLSSSEHRCSLTRESRGFLEHYNRTMRERLETVLTAPPTVGPSPRERSPERDPDTRATP